MSSYNKYHNGYASPNGHNSSFPTNHSAGDGEDEHVDFKHMFYSLWNRKWLIIGAVLILGLLGGILAFTATPIYQSEGSLLISDPQGGFSNTGSDLGSLLSSSYGIGVGSTLANELQVLKSRKLSRAIADTLKKEKFLPNGKQIPVTFESYPDDSTLASIPQIASRVRNNTVITKVDRDAEVVNITFESPSPYEAAYIANMTMAVYNDLSTRQNRTSANSATGFLEKERSRIEENLEDAEERLREFMNQSKLVEVGPQTENLIDQIASLEAARQQAKTKLVATNSAIDKYQTQLSNIKPGLAEKYSQAIGPNITKLQYAKSELEFEKQQLMAINPNLSESSPELLEINRKIETYKNRIKELTTNLIEDSDQYLGFLGGGEQGIAQSVSQLNQKLIEFQVQQSQYESEINVISTQLAQERQFFDNLPDNIVDLAKLKREVRINEELYTTVSQQYAETSLWEQTQFGLGSIIDNGYVPNEPVKPRKSLYILIGFVLGGILSVGFILINDAFNNTINGVEAMRQYQEPLLSVVPQMDSFIKENHDGSEKTKVAGQAISTSLVTILDSLSPISESFRRLENNLIYSNPDSKLKSIMVTSSGKGEGKTTTISNLGIVLAEAGYRTIIVDTDLRRPNLHNMFGIKKNPGFTEVLFDDIGYKEALQETVVPGLYALPAGRRPPNPSAVTQSKMFLETIKKLEADYDFVLIDTPPFGIITDASAMIKQTDGVVVVARFDETSEVQLSHTLEQLHRLNANVTGTVLTAFDYKESSDYYYGSRYYQDVYQDYNTYNADNA